MAQILTQPCLLIRELFLLGLQSFAQDAPMLFFNILKKLDLVVNETLDAIPWMLLHIQPWRTPGCRGATTLEAPGFEKARGDEMARNSLAFIGDSTFITSGSLL
jgi:hypothetical protein